MRKLAVVGLVAASSVAGAAIAWAALGGTLTGQLAIGGLATGTGVPCQGGNIDFEFGGPQWDAQDQMFQINSMSYSGFDSDCVTNGASLEYAIVQISNGNTMVDGNTVPTGQTGNIVFQQPIDAESAADYKVNYLVVG